MKKGFLRLLQLRDQTEAVREEMNEQRGRFEALSKTEKTPTVVSFNLFQTPPELAVKMAGIVSRAVCQGDTLLEPSAGLGRLYMAMRQTDFEGPVILCEQNPDCCKYLYDLTREDRQAKLKQGDFLTMTVGPVDAVIMNPPFKQGLDIKHIVHALDQLKPGGFLLSLCYDGVRQNKTLKPMADTWEPLPEGSFISEGTRAGVVLLTIRKR